MAIGPVCSAVNALQDPVREIKLSHQNHRRAAPSAGRASTPFFQQTTDIPSRLQRQETIHANLHSAAARACSFADAHSFYIRDCGIEV
jgi:hypothetical protein